MILILSWGRGTAILYYKQRASAFIHSYYVYIYYIIILRMYIYIDGRKMYTKCRPDHYSEYYIIVINGYPISIRINDIIS